MVVVRAGGGRVLAALLAVVVLMGLVGPAQAAQPPGASGANAAQPPGAPGAGPGGTPSVPDRSRGARVDALDDTVRALSWADPAVASALAAAPADPPAPPRQPGRLPTLLPEGASRQAGPGRADTAAAISRAVFAPGVPVVYVATGGTFPDALSGGPAAALGGGPLLLAGDDLPEVTRAELVRLRPGRIVVLGGTHAIPPAVEDALRALAPEVTRAAGGDRFATAAAVSAATFAPGVPTVYVATGATFPDALAGGPAAALDRGPLLLVGDDVPAATVAELQRLAPQRIVVLGGTHAVPQQVEDALRGLAPEVQRRSGPDRFTTAAAVAAGLPAEATGVAFLATGNDFPDALAGGAAAAQYGAPLLLAAGDDLPAATAAELTRLQPSSVVGLGGETALAADALEAAGEAAATEALPPAVLAAVEAGDLAALRAAVGDDPAVAYAAVRHLAHTPSYPGLAKGPRQTVAEGGGNAWDLAALLVDLLAEGATEARFATGRVTLPAGAAAAWVGVADGLTAARALAPTRGDVAVVTTDGEELPPGDYPEAPEDAEEPDERPAVTAVALDHVWVEARLGDAWVPLDPAFRFHILFGGRNPAADAGLDPQAATEELLAARGITATVPPETDEALAAARVGPVDVDAVTAVADARRTAALEWFEAQDPGVTLAQALGAARPVRAPVVPGAEDLPADTAPAVERFDEVPEAAQQFVRLQLDALDEVVPLAELAGRRLSVDFVPGDAEDAAEIEANGGLLGLAPFSVRLRPRLLLDGEPFATAGGDDAIGLANSVNFDVGYSLGRPPADGQFPEEDQEGPLDLGTSGYRVVSGGSYALATPTGRVPAAQLAAARDRLEAGLAEGADVLGDAVMGEQLHALGLAYFASNDLVADYLAGTSDALLSTAPRGALVGHDLVYDADDLSVGVAAGGFFIDVKRNPQGFLDRTGDPAFSAAPLQLASGIVGSTLEHDLFERGLGLPALSTMELLEQAATDETLLSIGPENLGALQSVAVPGLFTRLELTLAVSSGQRLVIPQTFPGGIGEWEGTGWILFDPETGSASYSISGGLEGGAGLLDLLGLSPDQQKEILAGSAGLLVAFLDGFLLGDLNRAGYDDPLLELFRVGGQVLSGLLVFGDVRDILVNAGRVGDDGGLGLVLAIVGLIPGGELARGVRLLDDIPPVALRSDEAAVLLRGAVGDALPETSVRIARLARRGAIEVSPRRLGAVDDAVNVRLVVGGLAVDDVYVPAASTRRYLDDVGIAPDDFSAAIRTGRLGDAAADSLARQRGWTRVDVEVGPNVPGVDRVYRKPDGTFVVVENKATAGSAATGPGTLKTEVGGDPQYELSDRWLTGDGSPNPDNNAVQRAVDAGKLTEEQGADLLAAIRAGTYERELVVVRTPPNGNSVTSGVGAGAPGLDGSDGGPVTRVTVIQLFAPGTAASVVLVALPSTWAGRW